MARPRLYTVYALGIAAAGLLLSAVTTLRQAPGDLHSDPADVVSRAVILLLLTFLSSISPMKTRYGASLTVGLAPLFGALLILPPWAVMWVAALGTVDERIPGRKITWTRFVFTRGMLALVYGLPSLGLSSLELRPTELAWYFVQPVAVSVIVSLNVGLVALFFTLLQGSSFWHTAKNTFAGNWLTYIALPVIGYLIYVFLKQPMPERLVVFLLYGPLLVYRVSLQKQNRLDQWLRDSFIMQSRVVDKRDGQTFGHSQRVGEMCEAVARALHLNEEMCNTIRVGGILHDLGKIAIPDSILLKPAKLTPEEYEIIKTHPVEGAQILAEHPEQKGVAEIVHHHHERWDGAGYPDGIKGEAIPIGSRIVNACDAFDTITQARVFRPTVRTPREAIEELRSLAGSWYDPAVIAALEKIVAERWHLALAPRPAPARTPGYREVLAIPSFRRLWIGQAVSYFGDMMNTAGLAIMLFLVTGSASLVALGLISKAIPTIVLGLVAGPLVDRFNRQRLMIATDLVRAILTVAIPFVAVNWLPGVFVLVVLISTGSTLFNPAKQAIIPNLVPTNLLVRANSLIFSSERTMELFGYSMAGIIAATVSWKPLFLVDAATYIFSAFMLLGVAQTASGATQKQLRILREIREGMRFILASPTLRSVMGLTTTVAFFAGMTYPTLVVLTYGALRSNAFGYGILEAAIGAGAILGAVASPVLLARFPAGNLILGGTAAIGIGYALTGLSTSLVLAGIFLFICGLANLVYLVPMVSVSQREALDFIRGRVMSSRFLVAQAGLLGGMAVAGPLADRVGAPLVFLTAGGLLACAAVLGLGVRDLRNARLRDEPEKPALKATASG